MNLTLMSSEYVEPLDSPEHGEQRTDERRLDRRLHGELERQWRTAHEEMCGCYGPCYEEDGCAWPVPDALRVARALRRSARLRQEFSLSPMLWRIGARSSICSLRCCVAFSLSPPIPVQRVFFRLPPAIRMLWTANQKWSTRLLPGPMRCSAWASR